MIFLRAYENALLAFANNRAELWRTILLHVLQRVLKAKSRELDGFMRKSRPSLPNFHRETACLGAVGSEAIFSLRLVLILYFQRSTGS